MSNGTQISGFGINVYDLDRSAEFYTGALGLQEKAKYDLGEMHEVLVGGEHDTSAILLVKHSKRTEEPEPGNGFEKIVLGHRRRQRRLRALGRARVVRRCRSRGRSSRWASRWRWCAIPTAT